ncbi:MAG TPA: hypothetical protein VGK73_30595, partial [Polyangiaceae bacterium]
MRLHEPASGPEKPAGRSPKKALGPWLSSLRRRPPFTWPKKRKRRLFIGFLVLLLAYPVLGTLALW